MVAFNVSGSWIYLTLLATSLILFSLDLADDISPLISYSPAGAWTDSPSNDSSAPVRPTQHDTFIFTR